MMIRLTIHDFEVIPLFRLAPLYLTAIVFLMVNPDISAQDYTWWNTKHTWDGRTPWHQYITLSPSFMGPNALPVPILKNGLAPSATQLKIGIESNFSPGDKTQNLYSSFYLSLFENKVGLMLQMVPIEFYQMDTFTRDARMVRDFDGRGHATGDLYIGTYFQILRDKKGWPDILLSINLKTASGNNLSAARFTDTPGYYFDISLGKNIEIKSSALQSIRPHLTGGFYVWQTYRSDYHQNDALLFGGGIDLNGPKYTVKNSVGGYKGYIGNGDQPLIYRLILEIHFDSPLNFEFQYQIGIRDMPYNSLRFTCRYDFTATRNHKTDAGNGYFNL